MAGGDWKEMLMAVHEDNINLVKYHIGNGIDPNYQHPELLTTPLIDSIAYNRYEITKYLLENGADPCLRAGFSEETPLIAAKRVQNKEIIDLIKTYLPNKSLVRRLVERFIT